MCTRARRSGEERGKGRKEKKRKDKRKKIKDRDIPRRCIGIGQLKQTVRESLDLEAQGTRVISGTS